MKSPVRGALLACGVLLLAGCGTPAAPDAPPQVDGDAAYQFVAGLVTDAQGEPRFRVPGTPGHADGAAWLWDALQVPGWSATWQNFTGADYEASDKGSVSGYASSCPPDAKARVAGLSFHNFLALQDGSDEQLVLLGAHWESKRFASEDPDPARRDEPVLGANDGAAGVGLLLQLMRHVAEHDVDLPFRLGVVFFDGEDGFEDCHPLAGSVHFVSQLAPGEVDRFLLLDMVGDPDARFVQESASVRCDPTVTDLLHAHAGDAGLMENFPGRARTVSDDHVPFLEAGIPATDLIDFGRTGDLTQSRYGFPPYWHTTQDTLEHIDAAMLGNVGDLVLAVVSDPAFAATWPATC